MSTADFFDVNAIGSDSHLQFMNWTAVNNGAYDYAADTRGYTYGFLAEFYDRSWVFRFGEMLMPTVANGITLDWDLARARAENYELELHGSPLKKRASALRLLSFVNHANMGSYRGAINGYLSGHDPIPDVTEYRKQGRVKYGFGVNVEQEITSQWRAFGRLGWNEGANESFAYTEVDRDASLGSDLFGKLWHRPNDKVGAAFMANAITGDHREYLALGGLGFILGDGHLNYGLEKILRLTTRPTSGVASRSPLIGRMLLTPATTKIAVPSSVVSFRIHIEDAVPMGKIAAAIK